MIKFEIDNSKEGVEILINSEGIEELINYLHFIKNNRESFHLIVGNELSEEESQNGNIGVKHVKLIFLD